MNDFAEHQQRRERLLPALTEARADAFLITALPNVRYLTGFTGSNAALLLTSERALLITDPRYGTQAPQESDCEVKVAKGLFTKELLKWTKRLGLRSLAFERNRISFDFYNSLKEDAKEIRLKAVTGAVEGLRMVKSPYEIDAIRASVLLNSKALQQALRHFRRGMREIDLAAEIDYRMRRLGADNAAFETIVASGRHSSLPHAHPTEQPIYPDQLLLIDMGAKLAGYASDMTRTYAVGRLNRKARQMYGAVLEGQLAGIDAVKPGATCMGVDRAARQVLGKYGFEKLFVHSTGHGLGLEIHEPPKVGRKEAKKLEEGMVITIEPGVYAEDIGGVRVEDTVLVTSNGCEVLTPTEKTLYSL